MHTRLKGLSREQKNILILNHLKKNKKGYMKDFKDVFQYLDQKGINNLLQELKKAGKAVHIGSRRSGYWVLKESN